jgi:hypothetical protein
MNRKSSPQPLFRSLDMPTCARCFIRGCALLSRQWSPMGRTLRRRWIARYSVSAQRRILIDGRSDSIKPRIVLPAPDECLVLHGDPEQTPQDAWYSVEDLWLRLAGLLPARAEIDGTTWRFIVSGVREALDREIEQLRIVALNVRTYGWQLDGQRGSFIRSIDFEADDLIFTVASISTIVRWPQGDDLGWQVKGFFARLRTRQCDDPVALQPRSTLSTHGGRRDAIQA